MWQWQHRIPLAEEENWKDITAPYPNCVLTQLPEGEEWLIEIYWEDEAQALLFAACYGGEISKLEEMDWVAATAPENQPPLLIRDKIVISSSECPDILQSLKEKYPRRIILTLPAEMAFGTGDHATTSTCLRLLCDYAKARQAGDWRVIDAGCGTAILALAALKLGASHAIAYDFDPQAVEISQRNVERNGGAEALSLFQADVFAWQPAEEERADLLMANLFATVLQKAFPQLIASMKAGGTLIISGILRQQAAETLAVAQQQGLVLDKSVTRGKWTTAQLHLPA